MFGWSGTVDDDLLVLWQGVESILCGTFDHNSSLYMLRLVDFDGAGIYEDGTRIVIRFFLPPRL